MPDLRSPTAPVPAPISASFPSRPESALAALTDRLPAGSFEVRGATAVVIRGLAYRSSDVARGALFFCVPGERADGHDFAGQAARAGAAALVVDRWLDVEGPAQVRVPSVRDAMGPMSAAFYGRPSERLSMLGVTGTNGKTTTTYLLEGILRRSGVVPGVIGTTGVRIDGVAEPFDRTTPEAPDLQRLLARMVERGVGGVAMEVSSHGLAQHRVDGTLFGCAVFTNLSQDHLDFHGTMEEYLAAKARLFTPDLSIRGVVNVDDPAGRRVAAAAAVPVTTFGLAGGADVRATEVDVGPRGLAFRVGSLDIKSSLRAPFNVSNCLAAIAAARAMGIDDAAIAQGIADTELVPGRLEPVDAGQDFGLFVDYAHTEDSLENVLRAARALTAGRVVVAFGCGGDRDRGKRPRMGEAATSFADLALVTSDNPRSEDPLAIIEQILPGARRGGGAFVVEPDRRAAIRLAIAEARPGDVVIIAGKGHESGQEFADRTEPFDDRIVAREELQALLSIQTGGRGGSTPA
jgi:UDP-N-acetylmuramoyl-L-alanyl-D-glutamate--2,6-diaminopimelate ligase